jgi:ketosteroid isomerase-like protein
MNEQASIDVVKGFFNAFVSGNIEAVAQCLTDDVEYLVNGDPSDSISAIPWGGRFQGHDGFRKFVAGFGASIEVLEITPQQYIAQDDAVAVFGHFKYRARPTQKIFESNFAINIKVRDGKIARYHFFEDTYNIVVAFRHGGSWDIENDGRRRNLP